MTYGDLDGRTFFAFTSRHAFGCSGWEDADSDGHAGSTFVVAAPDADAKIEAITDTWDALWVKHAGVPSVELDRARAAAERLGITWQRERTSQAPRWTPSWLGTLAQFVSASTDHDNARRQHVQEVEAALKTARLALFASIGARAVDLWVPSARHLVHDFGCMCGHYDAGDSDGGGALVRVRDAQVYVTPDWMTTKQFEELLTQADAAGEVAYAKAVKELADLDVTKLANLRTPMSADVDAEGHLTYDQWHAAHVERGEQIAAALVAGDSAALTSLNYRGSTANPAKARANAASLLLQRKEISALNDDDAATLAAFLRAS